MRPSVARAPLAQLAAAGLLALAAGAASAQSCGSWDNSAPVRLDVNDHRWIPAGSHGYRGFGSYSNHRSKFSLSLGLNSYSSWGHSRWDDDCDDYGWGRRTIVKRSSVCLAGCGCSVCVPVRTTKVIVNDCDDGWYRPSRVYSTHSTTIVRTAPVVYAPPPRVIVQEPAPVVITQPAREVRVEIERPEPVIVRTEPAPVVIKTEPAPVVIRAEPATTTVRVDATTPLEMGKLALRSGQPERAVRFFREHLQNPETDADGATVRLLALALLDGNRMLDAGEAMRKAYRTDVGLVELPLDAAEHGLTERRIRALTVRAVEYANREKTADAWLTVAVLMQGQGRGSVARQTTEQAIAAGLERQIGDPLLDAIGQ